MKIKLRWLAVNVVWMLTLGTICIGVIHTGYVLYALLAWVIMAITADEFFTLNIMSK